MIFNDRTYSVLIVSSSEKFSSSLIPLLPKYSCSLIQRANSIAMAKREMNERRYDLVIINSPLTDDSGMTFCADISASDNTICLIIVKADICEDVTWRLYDKGVFTLSKPTSPSAIRQVLRYMMTARERLRIMQTKSVSLEDKMKEIKTLNRAKWLLIEHETMSEAEAHRYIEKQAMDTCSPKLTIANDIIGKYS